MLPSLPPRYATFSALLAPIKVGEQGWRAFALQKALNSIRFSEATTWPRLETDGDFGPATLGVVKQFQNEWLPPSDGIAGSRTQAKLLVLLGERTHTVLSSLPDGLMRGLAEGEGANVLAATNWSVEGGVDCGPMQIRVLGPPFAPPMLVTSFDPLAAMLMSAEHLLSRASEFKLATWVRQQNDRQELSLRLAVLAHNWPWAAEKIASSGAITNPNGLATWVPSNLQLPDGTPIRTRIEWCRYYALGWPMHDWPGAITRYVKEWV